MIGRTLGGYRLLEKLGEGGMGEVYLAEDPRLGRNIALKILPAELAADPDRRRRFEREARAASALKHPNVTHIYEVGEDDGLSFIAMEHVEGEDLAHRLRRQPLETAEILRLAVQIADALDDAHSHGVVHRDLKPANLFITPRGQAKVLDFGLAKLEPEAAQPGLSQLPTMTKTAAGVVMGTVQYMSPEQAMGREVDARSDLFSFGVVLYEMAAGRLPFLDDSATGTIDKIVHAPVEPLARFNRDIPEELERIVRKCLEKDPANRYQSARELVVDLRNLRRDSQAVTTVSSNGAAARSPRRRLLPWGAAAAGLALLAAAVVFFVSWPASAIDSIAILPFENDTGDARLDYLCDGIPESLIMRLSQLPDLKVISRASAFSFRGQDKSPQEIGRELDVRAILLGRMVDRQGELSISTELVDVSDNEQLWGGRFLRSPAEVTTMEEELVTTIAQTLRKTLTVEEEALLARSAPPDSAAYQLYLKGRHFLVGTQREMDKAVDYLQQAVTEQPVFALAHATLAEAHTMQAFLTSAGREEVLSRAKAAVERALELDSELSEAHAADGTVRLYFDWDWRGAERAFRRAVELGPANASAWTEYSNYLLCMGRAEEAMAAARKAVSLDPMSILPTHHLGIAHMVAGDYENAAAQFRKVLELHPTWIWGHVKLAMALSNLGRHQEALASAARGEELAEGNPSPLTRSWLAWIHAKAGDRARAEQYLAELGALRAERYVDPLAEASIHSALGRSEATLEALERAFDEHSVNLIYLKISTRTWFRDVASDPRYQDLLRRMELG